MKFDRYYKGPKHYFPGDPLNYNLEDSEEDQLKKQLLNKELILRKESITRSLKKLFQEQHLAMKAKPLLYPCYFKSCNFQGYNLKRHLESSAHLLPSEAARLQQSYLTREVNYLTKVSKVKQSAPVLCSKCRLFFDRIDLHLHNQHQIRRKTKELEKQLIKSKSLTQNFLDKFNSKGQIDNKETETNEKNRQKSETAVAKQAPKLLSKNEDPEKLENKKDNSKKMGPSSSTEIRLRGRYVKAEPDEKEKLSLLQNKLPLTKTHKKNMV